jgi:hypothetical protein
MIWMYNIERTAAKVLRIYVRTYSLFISRCFSTHFEITLHKALIMLVMTYVCPTWDYAVNAYLLKFQRLQNRLRRAIRNLDRFTLVRVAFIITYVYDYVTKLCRTQAEVNPKLRRTEQEEARNRSIRTLNLAAVRLMAVQLTNCNFRAVK